MIEPQTDDEIELPDWQHGSWYETPKGTVEKKDWERMLGHTVMEHRAAKGNFTMENTVMEMKDSSFVMKMMYQGMEKTIAKGFGGKADYANPEFKMMMMSSADCSLSAMQINGGLKGNLMEGLLDMANGHLIRGMEKILKK
jgi:hypothetical protein